MNLSEEAFGEPTSFDHLPLVYFRFARPLKTDSPLPAPVDLTKLHERKGPMKSFSFDYRVGVENIVDKKFLMSILTSLEEDDLDFKNMFM